jgi:Flp pilus assembly protein TadD
MNRKERRAKGKAASDSRLDRAMALHQAGRFLEADAVYRQVLTDRPTDRDALRLRGALAYQIGNAPAAAELLAAARQADPRNPEVLTLLGLALEGAGNPEGAERAYREGLAIAPRSAELWNNLGALLRETGRLEAALDAFGKALSLRPDYADARQNLAVSLFHAGRLDESLDAFEAGLAARPGDPELLLNQGVVLNAANRPVEAIAAFKDAARHAPDDPDLLTNLSAAYLKLEDVEKAEEAARKARDAAPESAGAAANLAVVLTARRGFDQAEALYHEALRGAPEFADIWSNYGNMLLAADRPAEAAVAYRKAVQFAPDDPRHRFQAGLCALSRGALAEGWDGYEAGLDCGERVPAVRPDAPRWTGGALDGGTLLIVPEQGIGDEIRNLSCLPDVLAAAGDTARVLVGCDGRLAQLVARAFPSVEAVARDALRGAASDAWIPQASLPGLFRRSPDAFPDASGYFRADPERVAEIDARLPDRAAGPRIGLAWRSGSRRMRSAAALTDIEAWDGVLAIPGACFVTLQYGAEPEELAGRRLISVPDLDLTNDLDGAAALTACCDLVINMGTSVGDMAGALGVPCWSLMLKGDWVALGTDRHPFFPTTRLFWRGPNEAWDTVVARVRDALQRDVIR